MPQRIAAISSIAVFAGCLMVGAIGAENTFTTAVERALIAMMATLFVGLIVGWMAQRMINENVAEIVKPPVIVEPREVAKPPAAKGARGK